MGDSAERPPSVLFLPLHDERSSPFCPSRIDLFAVHFVRSLSLSLGLHSRSVPVDEQGGKKEGRQQGAIERGGNERARAAPMHDHLRFPVITSSLSLSLAPSPRRPESEKPLSLPPSASRCPIFVFAAAVASPQSPKLNLATLQSSARRRTFFPSRNPGRQNRGADGHCTAAVPFYETRTRSSELFSRGKCRRAGGRPPGRLPAIRPPACPVVFTFEITSRNE